MAIISQLVAERRPIQLGETLDFAYTEYHVCGLRKHSYHCTSAGSFESRPNCLSLFPISLISSSRPFSCLFLHICLTKHRLHPCGGGGLMSAQCGLDDLRQPGPQPQSLPLFSCGYSRCGAPGAAFYFRPRVRRRPHVWPANESDMSSGTAYTCCL